jgi:hypothetical protein
MGRMLYKMVEQPDGTWRAFPAHEVPSSGPRSAVVIQDTMDATRHPCDGRLYESKSEFRRVTRAHGCVEIGNESADTLIKDAERNRFKPGDGLKADILRTMEEIRDRRR